MAKEITVAMAFLMCCFFAKAQSNLDCAILQQKVTNALNKSKTTRMNYTSRERKVFLDFEKDANASRHLVVEQPYGEKNARFAMIATKNKTYYGENKNTWTQKRPVDFDADAWLDSCKNADAVLNQPFNNCLLVRDTKITGTPYSIYTVLVDKDTFKIWLNKKEDKIERMEGENKQKSLSLSWTFDVPFTIREPKDDWKDKDYEGFRLFSPIYSMEEFYDGEERVYNLGDENPKFKGGQAAMFKFIGQNFIIPKEYRENGPSGTRTVYIGFVVEKDGSITNVRVRRGISGLDEESMRVIKLMSGHWDAGLFEGQKVRMAYTLPIKTHLE